MTFTAAELDAFRDREVADLVDLAHTRPRLVFVGINPGLWTAATGSHFAHPTNRFYPALHAAGLTSRPFDRVHGLPETDRRELTDKGIAITNLVSRATTRASELSAQELRDGGVSLVARMTQWRPTVVAVAGVTAYRTAFARSRATMGEQGDAMTPGTAWWVVPNPSGLNAHETIASLAAWYRQVAVAAGVELLSQGR
ncbi:MAG: mismatch-specific DNA-glycosylase [Nitriliruptoraceae bacterium]